METSIFNALINAGGMGILSAVLLVLHVMSLRTFREELAKEREQCHDDHEKLMESVKSNHDLLTTLSTLATRRPNARGT